MDSNKFKTSTDYVHLSFITQITLIYIKPAVSHYFPWHCCIPQKLIKASHESIFLIKTLRLPGMTLNHEL